MMGAFHHAIPGPLLPIDVLDTAVTDVLAHPRCIYAGGALGCRREAEIEESQRGGATGCLEKASSGQGAIHESLGRAALEVALREQVVGELRVELHLVDGDHGM